MKITKIRAINFKRFDKIEIDFKENLNIIVGDNESGKSSILLAIDLVLSGSRTKVESLGLETLFNYNTIAKFFKTNIYNDLPKLTIELYFDDIGDADFYGRNNTSNIDCYGMSLVCEKREELGEEIAEILNHNKNNFPFEYYSISFNKFSGQTYSGFKKYFKHILLDNTQINNEYATHAYIKTLYNINVSNAEKNKHFNQYRALKTDFKKTVLNDLNTKTGDYAFSLKSNNKSNLESDLTITEDNIEIQNKGKGRQCFIKTEFALLKKANRTGFYSTGRTRKPFKSYKYEKANQKN